MLVGALVASAPARAQDDKQAIAVRDAQARFEEGIARAKAGDFESARVSFAQAYAVVPKPAIIWNLALTEEKTHRPLDALGHFREFMRQTPTTDPDRIKAQKHIDELSAVTGHIDVIAPTGAAITVDATMSAGLTPRVDPIDVVPGHHLVEARLGSQSKSIGVEAVPGQTVVADFRGPNALAPAAPSNPGATAPQANGEPSTPPAPAPPPPDRTTGGGVSTARIVTVAVVGGTAVVAAGLGLGWGMASNSENSHANDLRTQIGSASCLGPNAPSQCATLASTTSAQHTNYQLSTAMWITGGVLAVSAAALWFLWPKSSPSGSATTVHVVPTAGAGSAGVVAIGSF